MRKVYLDKLPKKYGIGANRNKLIIDWKNSIGYIVNFIYDDIVGEIEIIDYKNSKLILQYNGEAMLINTDSFKACNIGVLLGKIQKQYKYNVGEIVNGLEILKQLRMRGGKYTQKGYRVKCIKDGYIHEKYETSLYKGVKCPVCCNQKIMRGVNDVATTHPYLIKYFTNIEDMCTHSYASNKKINLKCPNCGSKKSMSISKLSYYGFSCPKCSDGKSYPEKFVFDIFKQLNINFKIEHIPSWVKSKRYDFYIPELDCIVETHGRQHYEDSTNSKWDRLEITQKNDKLKQQLAIENNIKHYVVLNCRKSDMEYIKNSILNSELNKLFDLTKIDWLKCHEFACSSRVKEACDLWNKGITNTNEISEIMKVSLSTVRAYLRQGKKLNWCNYDGKENTKFALKNGQHKSKKCRVILNDNETIYNSRKECIIATGLSDRIVDTLLKSKESFSPYFSRHKHLEGMRIEYM